MGKILRKIGALSLLVAALGSETEAQVDVANLVQAFHTRGIRTGENSYRLSNRGSFEGSNFELFLDLDEFPIKSENLNRIVSGGIVDSNPDFQSLDDKLPPSFFGDSSFVSSLLMADGSLTTRAPGPENVDGFQGSRYSFYPIYKDISGTEVRLHPVMGQILYESLEKYLLNPSDFGVNVPELAKLLKEEGSLGENHSYELSRIKSYGPFSLRVNLGLEESVTSDGGLSQVLSVGFSGIQFSGETPLPMGYEIFLSDGNYSENNNYRKTIRTANGFKESDERSSLFVRDGNRSYSIPLNSPTAQLFYSWASNNFLSDNIQAMNQNSETGLIKNRPE